MNRHRFILDGLNCAHCAGKIEEKIKKIYPDTTFNFLNKELTFSSNNETDKQIIEIQNIVDFVEEGVTVKLFDAFEISENNKCSCGHNHNLKKSVIIRFSLGAISFIVGLVFNNLYLMLLAYIVFGYDVIYKAFKNISKGQIFDENFLMTIATFGAIYIQEYPEAVAVMLFYQIGEFFQDMAVEKSRNSIKELMDLKIEAVNKLDGNTIVSVEPESVKIGDIIIVKVGEKVPVDSVVIDGESYVDTSALTGESVPVKVKYGDSIKSGVINKEAVLKLKVEKLYSESTIVKIMEMVENATARKSKVENIITKFAKIYTPVVVFSAVAIAVIPVIFGEEFNIWLDRALIFLVSSCPCALVVSVPLTFFSGLGKASKNGVLIKGSNYLQMLSEINTVVLDKTGTITEGVFKVQKFTDEKTLSYAASLERYSNHPIAKAILESYNAEIPDAEKVTEISGYGLKGIIDEKVILVGNAGLMKKEGVENIPVVDDTVVYVAEYNKLIGTIIVSDNIKSDSKIAIEKLNQLGVENIVMLTGDKKEIAEKISEKVGIKIFFAELLPQDKVKKLEELFINDNKVAFIGDGINDAPVLARADVGIAMGGIGSDAAIEAADVVIMNDQLSKLKVAIKIARRTINIIKQNIVFVLLIKFAVLGLAVFGMGNMWLAVFADVGVALLAVLNATR